MASFIESVLNKFRQPVITEQKTRLQAAIDFSVDENTLTRINDSLRIHPYGTQFPLSVVKKEPVNEFGTQPGLYCYTGIVREKWDKSPDARKRYSTILNETFQVLGLIGANDKLSFESFLTSTSSIVLKIEKPLKNFK